MNRWRAGRIGKLWGLGDIRIGDSIGAPRDVEAYFAPPSLETVVSAVRPEQTGALHAALTQLAESDPLINLRQDEIRHEISVSLYGEVQKEVIQATLADEFGVAVTFRETTTICVERPVGTGAAAEIIAKAPNPFLATVGLCVEPAPTGSGVQFRLGVELGSMPYAFIRAVEETVRETLGQGLHGWQVTDCVVTMTHSGYFARQSHAGAKFDKSMSSTAGDFRNLTPLVLLDALRLAGTAVCEPMHRFRLDLPATLFASILPVLIRPRRRGGHLVGPRRDPVRRGRPASRAGAPGRAGAAGPDQRRRHARNRLRPLPPGAWPGAGAVADRPQSAQPQGISAARAARRVSGPVNGPARRPPRGRVSRRAGCASRR